MWVDKYCPNTQDELAVHKKKIFEVSEWLDNSFKVLHNSCPILLLTGDCGTGKTATIRVLAREKSLRLIEWFNPLQTASQSNFRQDDDVSYIRDTADYEPSQSTKFSDFLFRGARYPTLNLTGSQTSVERKLILIEDLPNIFLHDPTQFQILLRRFVKSRGVGEVSPIIFILSDCGGGNAAERSMFPVDMRTELSICTIRFNPISATAMYKALARVAAAVIAAFQIRPPKKCSGVSDMKKARELFSMPSQTELDDIVESSKGDVRAAINALEFFGLNRRPSCSSLFALPFSAASAKTRYPSRRKNTEKNRIGHETSTNTACLKGRDINLSLFHALGKLLYCKRKAPAPEAPKLPDYMSMHERDELLVEPENVIDRVSLSPQYFIAFLHQNYIDFYSSVDDISAVADYLSDCDELACNWSTRLALSRYSSSIAARAVSFCNSSRASASCQRRLDGVGWRPMHRPQSLETMKKADTRLKDVRLIFRDVCVSSGQTVGSREFITDVIPHWWAIADANNCNRGNNLSTYTHRTEGPVLKNLLQQTWSVGQKSCLKEIGQYPRGNYTAAMRLETLNEFDVGESLVLAEAEDCTGSDMGDPGELISRTAIIDSNAQDNDSTYQSELQANRLNDDDDDDDIRIECFDD